METTAHNHKIDEALHLLNQAAKDKKDDLHKLITEKYSNIRGVFKDDVELGREALNQFKTTAGKYVQDGREKITQAASDLDQQVHKHPWQFIGGVAVGALLLGLVLGSKASSGSK